MHCHRDPHRDPYTGESMTLKGRDLFLVPEGGPSRLFHFRLNDQEA